MKKFKKITATVMAILIILAMSTTIANAARSRLDGYMYVDLSTDDYDVSGELHPTETSYEVHAETRLISFLTGKICAAQILALYPDGSFLDMGSGSGTTYAQKYADVFSVYTSINQVGADHHYGFHGEYTGVISSYIYKSDITT